MGEFLALSQSAILLPHSRVQAWNRRQHSFDHYQPFPTMPLSLRALTRSPTYSPHICTRQNRFMWGITAGGSDDGKDHSKRKAALSMSQKLTLGYAFLVGAGGVMGYLKSGSQKSLIAGGVSASLLYYVYTVLPTNPVFASSVGFVLSAGLLGVMGSRFMKSKKVFPAGIVSFVSLVMSGGYLHGILRSAH
nr:Protein FATTY ACID EXPORT 2, chloroplastic [Ipomoea batatas]GMD24010.1 Protein FATTY ACID EXPORT 2, chloroplastic [Ipomoea batatas]